MLEKVYGRVDGPYKCKRGYEYVSIIKHNEDGSVSNKYNISYFKYLREILLIEFNSIINALFNPEFWALKQILK